MFNLDAPHEHLECRVDQFSLVAMDASPRAFLTIPDRVPIGRDLQRGPVDRRRQLADQVLQVVCREAIAPVRSVGRVEPEIIELGHLLFIEVFFHLLLVFQLFSVGIIAHSVF